MFLSKGNSALVDLVESQPNTSHKRDTPQTSNGLALLRQDIEQVVSHSEPQKCSRKVCASQILSGGPLSEDSSQYSSEEQGGVLEIVAVGRLGAFELGEFLSPEGFLELLLEGAAVWVGIIEVRG